MALNAYESVEAFLTDAQAFLEQDAATNNLILGICLQFTKEPDPKKGPWYLATVCEDGAIVLAAVMPPTRPLLLYGEARAIPALADDLFRRATRPVSVMGPSGLSEAFAETWSAMAGVTAKPSERQSIYRLDHVVFPKAWSGQLRPATEEDAPLLAQWLQAFTKEALYRDDPPEVFLERARGAIRAGELYVWEDGAVVSMAAKARPSAHGIVINRVYTPPEYRNRGYASACVAHLSQLLLDSDYSFCSLFADMANPTSNHIYREIGYTRVCDYPKYDFKEPV